MNKFIWTALGAIVASSSLSGCATFLYHDNNTSTTTPMKSSLPCLTASETNALTGENRLLPFLLFELTPLGIISPMLGYPAKALQYSQAITLNIDPPAAATKTGMTHEFHAKPGAPDEWVLDFDQDAVQKLKETGRVIAYRPRNIRIIVACDKRSCSASADPPIVGSDGTIHLESRDIEDKKRLKEIADEKRRQIEEEQRKQREADTRAQTLQDYLLKKLQTKWPGAVGLSDDQFKSIVGSEVNTLGTPIFDHVDINGQTLELYVQPNNAQAILSANLAEFAKIAEMHDVVCRCLGQTEVKLDLNYLGQGEQTLVRYEVNQDTGRGQAISFGR